MREREIFIAALQQAESEGRTAYLDEACQNDEGLRNRVQALLDVFQNAGSFLLEPAANLVPAGTCVMPRVSAGEPNGTSLPEGPGTVIGPYKLLEQIGEGGMGVVYMAEQTLPMRRKVALKIIKPGLDTKQVVARFEAERQALALMDHPNIARVFDGGTTESGRPYFVMELVRGLPITDYCDREQLSIAERLELFVLVCRAVQHAHQKGIIHRDLKPSNILVTVIDGVAVPKIIDFGVAKATGSSLTERTIHTGFAQLIGTPLYMSPEQADLSSQDIDTRSDIYSLGVLLYELLTGTTPFDPETLKRAAFDEMRRIIREQEPKKPSLRLSSLGDARTTVLARRGVDARRLNRTVRGELDWIAMKALEKDRRRRYETVNDLAADVMRYLTGQPVEACPPSAGYRLRKYVRRHRQVLLTAGVVMLALLTATAVSSWIAVDANAARQLADERLENVKKARNEAATESAVARAVNDFLQRDLLGQVHRSPWDAEEFVGTPDLTVREALDRAAATIGERFRNHAQVEAAVRLAIGGAYASLHRQQLALPHLEKAVALRRAILGSDHADTLDAARRLADIYGWVGRFRDGVAVLDAVLGKYERLFGPDHPTTLDCVSQQSLACDRAGMWDRAIMLAKQVLETRSATLGPTYPARAGDMQAVASRYSDAGLFVESIAWHEKTMAICEATQQHDLYPSNNYARALQGVGRLEEADHELRKALEHACKQRDRRARERQCAVVQKVLGLNLLLQGRYTEAEAVAREALAVLERYTPDHWSRFHAMSMVGGALLGQQRYAEAESCLVKGYEGMKQREATIDACFDDWLTKAGERLVRFYDVTDQPEKSRVWREKILQSKSMN